MRKYTYTMLIGLVLISITSLAQQKNYTTYKYGDSILIQSISRNIISEDMPEESKSAFILCVISISKHGKIDSVITLNSMKSSYSISICASIKKTEHNWLKGKKNYKIIIPFYFIDEASGNDIINIDYKKDFFPDNKSFLPIKGILLTPIIVLNGQRRY